MPKTFILDIKKHRLYISGVGIRLCMSDAGIRQHGYQICLMYVVQKVSHSVSTMIRFISFEFSARAYS